MERLLLQGGSYRARSVIAAPSRCINYYAEVNPKEALVPFTYYQRAGLVPLVQASNHEPVRGLYQASNNVGYAVVGMEVFKVESDFTLTHLGTLLGSAADPTNICSFIDNGTEIMLVDGSTNGYSINMGTNVFQKIVDPTGFFQGATRLDVIDTFIVWNFMQTARFGSTLGSQITPFDPTQYASKSVYPDELVTLIVNRHELLLMGRLKSEIWYDAGGATFPFAPLPGAYIEHGCLAKYSIASNDISVFWLGNDLQGSGIVFRQRGYQTARISNHALEGAIRRMKAAGADISDAIGWTSQQEGHVWYVLTFPSGDETWVFDESIADPTLSWHQEAWTDPADGMLHRHRGNCYATLYGKNVVGDWENGTLYAMDLDTYSDTVNGVMIPLRCTRTFPHIGHGRASNGQPLATNGRRVQFARFWLDMECGTDVAQTDAFPARVTLRWSVDRGKTYGQDVLQSAGTLGQYVTQPQWGPIGVGRDVIFEIEHNISGPAALNGAWVDAEVLPD